jgi:MOSC domain-containing protein YiiM
MQVLIHRLYVSPGHNFFGHHAAPPGEHPTLAVERIHCCAGRGIEGDRFFGYRPDYAGQITFFAWETFNAIRAAFGVAALSPGAFRRNVLLAGTDLNALIGARFSVDGVTFAGTGEARPCHWMNHAVAPGAEAWLKGRGGLRARVLTDGALGLGTAELVVLEKNAQPSHAAGFVGKRAVELGLERRV